MGRRNNAASRSTLLRLRIWLGASGSAFFLGAAVIGMFIGAGLLFVLGQRPVASAPAEARPEPERQLLAFRVARLDERIPDWNTQIGYKAKLTVILRNDGNEGLDLQRPRWMGVATQLPFAFAYSLEKTAGERDWSPQEFPEVRLDPGRSVRLWLGLDSKIPHDQLAKPFERVKLGSITIPMMVNGKTRNAEYQV